MKCVVTGAAGFIGSHLCEALLDRGHRVTGMDAFIPFYPQVVKHRNLLALLRHPNLRFYRLDLRNDPMDELLADAEVIFHLAAMPGLAQSWNDVDDYWTCNVTATRTLLEAVHRSTKGLQRMVFASASSVYGLNASGDETQVPQPISPYGITKLAAEQLCHAYVKAHNMPIVLLRYFSVYGPRQRPDMGYHRFIQAMLDDRPVTIYGDGQQVRSNTYVGDCVQATLAAMESPVGETYNVGGGETASVWDIVQRLEAIAGRKARIHQEPARRGDQARTCADTTKIRRQFDWQPRTPLDEGLAKQWQWQATANEAPFLIGKTPCQMTTR